MKITWKKVYPVLIGLAIFFLIGFTIWKDNRSYDSGYNDGLEAGYSDGRDEGYSDGQEDGYNEAYVDALDEFKTNPQAYIDLSSDNRFLYGYREGYLDSFVDLLKIISVSGLSDSERDAIVDSFIARVDERTKDLPKN